MSISLIILFVIIVIFLIVFIYLEPLFMKHKVKNDNEYEIISRHEVKCNLEDVIRVSSKLLKNNGKFFMVHRPERIKDIIINLEKYKMQIKEP